MNLVYLQKTEDRKDFTRKVLEEIREDIEKARKILLKPNIVSFEPYPTTTHSEVLETCLEFLLNLKKEVLVADGPAPDAGSSKKIIENHPLKKISDKYQIPLIDLCSVPMKKIKTPSFNLKISAIFFESDFVISLPVLKSHGTTSITGALKNQFGLLSPKERILFHTLAWKDIHKVIAEINLVAKPNFWIVDAVQTLIETNEIRHGGKLRDLGYMLAGKDPMSLDIEGLKLLKKVDPNLKEKKPEEILHLKYALDLKVGFPKYKIKNI